MLLEDWKIKISALWIFIAVTMSANTILYFVVPGTIDEIRAGKVVGMHAGSELLLVMAITYFWVPLVMAVLSLSLKNKTNRTANIILGIFYAGFILFELTMNITTVAYPYVILMDTSAIVVAALIVWNAWKSKQGARVLLNHEKDSVRARFVAKNLCEIARWSKANQTDSRMEKKRKN